ncbi:hypothetical protein KF946_10250 [Idiomarina loihiensis]|uniref:hypothetical protein n=1 Tax=Idiomarina loihiensis TaxID=135577 RepID=UPI0013058AE1|nr:hypothetical protein [Idiomarina loihiensis]MRJ44584.1 hypothetical protein [Idiomarina loihiensis]UTW32390.1 hypothetical protein KF946_10250 [Idiomarina loihiensis]
MAQIAGMHLHFDIPFYEIDERETEEYISSIVKSYSNIIFDQETELKVGVYEGSVKVYIALTGAIYLAIGQYGSFRSGIDYMIEDAKNLKGLVVSQLIKNGVSESDVVSARKLHCTPDKIRRVLLSIERLESKTNISKIDLQKELSKIKSSVRNICNWLDEKDVGLFASSIDPKYLPEDSRIPEIAKQYKINAREEDIVFFPLASVEYNEQVNKALKRN